MCDVFPDNLVNRDRQLEKETTGANDFLGMRVAYDIWQQPQQLWSREVELTLTALCGPS